MKIVTMKPSELMPYDKNPRHSNESIAHVMSSIKEFGFKQPIVVDSDHIVIIGHTRLQAAINSKSSKPKSFISASKSNSAGRY